MNFRLDEPIGFWVTDAAFRGKPITLRLTEHLEEKNLPDAAKEALAEVESRWGAIERNLADSLLATYNETWSDPEEGLPVLSREEFLRKIVLEVVDMGVDEGKTFTLYFGDSGLFAGHGVQIFWDPEKMYPATLVG